MNVTVYSRPDCLACDLVKSVLLEHDQNFDERIVGHDVSVDDFKANFPEAETVPYIIVDDVHIKYSEFLARFKEMLISDNKYLWKVFCNF